MDIALRDLDALPPPDEQVEIVRIDVSDCDERRFCLTFATADGRNLRVRLPSRELQMLSDVLSELAWLRRWPQ
jgi:hypothetical protein